MTDKCNRTDKEWAIQIAIGFVVFFASLWLSMHYVWGDQFGYHLAYSLIEGLGLQDGFFIYERNISNADFVHFVLSLLGSSLGIEKNVFMSFFNAFFAVYTLKLLEKWGVDFRVACLIVLTNFYMFVLYFAAERLKIGFIFLVLTLFYSNKPRLSYLLSLCSIGSHVSILLIYVSVGVAYTYDCFRSGAKLRPKTLYLSMLMLLPPLLIALYVSKSILWKLGTYMELNANLSAMSFVPLSLLVVLTGVYAKDIGKSLAVFAPFAVGVALLGASRLNMLAYFIFLGFGLRANAGLNAGVLITGAYFFYKSIVFVTNILEHGHGFP